jgi:hypothetical protein
VQALGGYKALAFHDIEYLHHMERRFGEHFEELREVLDTREAVPQLAQQTTGLTHVGRLRLPAATKALADTAHKS